MTDVLIAKTGATVLIRHLFVKEVMNFIECIARRGVAGNPWRSCTVRGIEVNVFSQMHEDDARLAAGRQAGFMQAPMIRRTSDAAA